MTFDIPHMIVTVIILFVVVWGTDQTSILEGMPKRRQALTKIAVLFVALVILNTIWPHGSGS